MTGKGPELGEEEEDADSKKRKPRSTLKEDLLLMEAIEHEAFIQILSDFCKK